MFIKSPEIYLILCWRLQAIIRQKTYFLRRSNLLRSVYLFSVPAQFFFFFCSYILLGLALQRAWLLGELIILLELRYLSIRLFWIIICLAIPIVFVGTILTRRLSGEFQRLVRSFSLSILFAILLCVFPWHSFNYNYTFFKKLIKIFLFIYLLIIIMSN